MPARENPLKIVDVSVNNQDAAKQLLDSAMNQGFLFVDGHDFTQEEVDRVFALSREFFKLPMSEKQKYPIDSDDAGYTAYNQELLDPETQKRGDPKEAFNFGRFDFTTGEPHNDGLPELFTQEENYELVKSTAMKLFKLGNRVLELLAIGLEIDEAAGGSKWFNNRHTASGKSITALRFLHYPSQSQLDSEDQVRAGAHTDYGSVTLLFQQKNEEGLELFTNNNKWELIPYIESPNQEYVNQKKAAPIIVNIGDALSYWTAGILKSTMHRVVLPPNVEDRYSTVFFFNADNDVPLEPIPSRIVEEAQAAKVAKGQTGKVMTTKEYLDMRFAATYVEGH